MVDNENGRKGEEDLLRGEGKDSDRPAFPELFFDLVFVFALIQLSHTLAEDFGAISLIEAAILLLALWWVWIHTTLVMNLLDPHREPVRLVLFALMFCGLVLSLAIPQAFGERGLLFAAVYGVMQVGRSLFSLFAHRHADRATFITFLRIALWLTASALLWLAGGLADVESRLLFWGAALLVEYAAPALDYYIPGLMRDAGEEALEISGEHFAERSALFIIICLGETILATGRTAAEHIDSPTTIVAFCCAFAGTVLMWWIYFHDGQEKAARKAENAANPQKAAEMLFIYGHLPIVVGIVLTAVGEEFTLSHPQDAAGLRESVAIAGGPALFLTGAAIVKYLAAKTVALSHGAGLAVLLVLLVVPGMPLLALQFSATVVLLVVAVWEYAALRRRVKS